MRKPADPTFRSVHPYQEFWAPLETDPGFILRPMFGGRAIYIDGRLVLYFTAKSEPWRGILVCTERAQHAALQVEFPAMLAHPVLPKWLYLSETVDGFERLAAILVSLARRRDPRLGVLPPARRRNRRGRRRVRSSVPGEPPFAGDGPAGTRARHPGGGAPP